MDDQVSFARNLRRQQTKAERHFWALLHVWRTAGWHFRRQSPIGPYVADFVCKRLKLIIEIDGDSHHSDPALRHDAVRTTYLEAQGYGIVRFTNLDVLERSEGVFEVLRGILGEPSP